VYEESLARGYEFDAGKAGPVRSVRRIPVTDGQVAYEWEHLMRKLSKRNPPLYRRWRKEVAPALHPLFRLCTGPIAEWERVG
jgi:hypothetical protein